MSIQYIPLEAVIGVVRDHVSCRIGEETVILNADSGVYIGLNAVGSRILDLLQDPMTIAKICNTLIQEYAVPRNICEHEVGAFVDALHRLGLVSISAPSQKELRSKPALSDLTLKQPAS